MAVRPTAAWTTQGRAAGYRTGSPGQDISTGCRTAAGSRPTRIAFTVPRHRARQAERRAGQAERRAGMARPRPHRTWCPRSRTRSAATGGDRPRLPLARLSRHPLLALRYRARPARAAQSRALPFQAAQSPAVPFQAAQSQAQRALAGARDMAVGLAPPADPDSRRYASTQGRRVLATMPPTAANA